jgi:hypothetical protein
MEPENSQELTAPQDERLSAFQAALLELLSQPLSPDELIARLRTDAAFAPFADYIETFEPRMVEVAAALVKKWGRLAPTDEITRMPH